MPREMQHGLPTPRPSSFLSLLSGWVQQGVESFFATQRILVDLAIRQNSNVMKTLREGLSDPEHSPSAIVTELAVEGTANFIEAQRVLLDLAQKESELIMNGVKERMGSNAGVAMSDFVRRGIETFVDMQQEFLTIASKQTQHWLHATKTGKPYDGEQLAEFARESMQNFVRAQKKFLDVVAEETENATSGKPPKKLAKTELTKVAREATDTFIDAQKKLLDLAGQQVHANLQAAHRTMGLVSSLKLPIGNMTGEGVRTFVDAEKTMIDNMIKSYEGAKEATAKPEHRPKTRARARRAAPAQAAAM